MSKISVGVRVTQAEFIIFETMRPKKSIGSVWRQTECEFLKRDLLRLRKNSFRRLQARGDKFCISIAILFQNGRLCLILFSLGTPRTKQGLAASFKWLPLCWELIICGLIWLVSYTNTCLLYRINFNYYYRRQLYILFLTLKNYVLCYVNRTMIICSFPRI